MAKPNTHRFSSYVGRIFSLSGSKIFSPHASRKFSLPTSKMFFSPANKLLFLVLTTLLLQLTAQAAAPVGQTIWIRASATGLFVSADQNRGTFAPLVADRSTADAWEQFQVVDAGGGFIAFRSIGTG